MLQSTELQTESYFCFIRLIKIDQFYDRIRGRTKFQPSKCSETNCGGVVKSTITKAGIHFKRQIDGSISSMYTKSSVPCNPNKTRCISRWKDDGAPLRPNGILLNSLWPLSVEKTVLCLSSGSIGIWFGWV